MHTIIELIKLQVIFYIFETNKGNDWIYQLIDIFNHMLIFSFILQKCLSPFEINLVKFYLAVLCELNLNFSVHIEIR